MRLDVVYGISGVGKTTLCSNINDAYFINLGHHKDFNKIPMGMIFKNEYFKKNTHNYYITEACLHGYNGRSNFIKHISDCLKADILNVFYLYTNLDIDKKPDNKNMMPIGCKYGNHYIIKEKTLEGRINYINQTNKNS